MYNRLAFGFFCICVDGKTVDIAQKSSEKPTVTSLITGGKRRLVYAYEDGRQIIEQYDIKTFEILSRKCKKPTHFKEAKWEYEIGQIQEKGNPELLIKANTTPIFIRRDTLDSFQWRIRNLPYPHECYIMDIDQEKQEIIIKTTIKKYYKKFDIPDLKKLNIKLLKDMLSFAYQNNTLVVSYKKPDHILEREIILRKEFQKMNAKKPKQGDIECTTQ